MNVFHVHLSVVGFLTTAMYIIIFGFFWRLGSALCHRTALGQAAAFIY
jgi:hypothetical protein